MYKFTRQLQNIKQKIISPFRELVLYSKSGIFIFFAIHEMIFLKKLKEKEKEEEVMSLEAAIRLNIGL
jgi:hypothetical protein